MKCAWRPAASVEALRARSELLHRIRDFFYERGIIEVQTPTLGSRTVSDPHIESIRAEAGFLQTSPEFFMKRLLASGTPSCFQICSAFRKEESGRWHNPEFTMLEWYRLGFNSEQLRDEVTELVDLVLGPEPIETLTYRCLIENTTGIDAFENDMETIHEQAQSLGYEGKPDFSETCDFLYAEATRSKQCSRYFVIDFPVHSAALAQRKETDQGFVADRFELIVSGLELANGYRELTDFCELKRRIDKDNQVRVRNMQARTDPDEFFLDAMRAGLPECSGVALGVDRLVALALDEKGLEDVTAFPWNRA